MGKVGSQAKPEKKQKPINKKHKYIWFAVSMAVFLLGIILAKAGVSFENYVIKAVYALAVFFPLLVAAQKVSYERIDTKTGKLKSIATKSRGIYIEDYEKQYGVNPNAEIANVIKKYKEVFESLEEKFPKDIEKIKTLEDLWEKFD